LSRLAVASLAEAVAEEATATNLHAVAKRLVDHFADRPVMYREVEVTLTIPLGLSARGSRYISPRLDLGFVEQQTATLVDRIREGLDESGQHKPWRGAVAQVHAARWVLDEIAKQIKEILD